MPPTIAALAFSLAAISAPTLLAQTDPVVASRAEYREAMKAYEAHDTLAFLRHASEAARLRPTHGGVLYALASAGALAGDSTVALSALRHFAALGYTADVDSDADLASLRGIAAFDSIRAELRRNAAPIVRSKSAFTLADRELLTEGIAYDSVTSTFLVGSVRRGTILRVQPDGRAKEFVHAGLTGFGAPLGLRVDAKRRALWVASSALPQTMGFDSSDTGRSGIFRFDLATGALTGRYAIPPDGEPHALGDVLVARNGDVYATDSRAPAVYRVRAGADTIERFVTSPLLLSAQGLALDSAERTLFVADYARGLLRIDLASREVLLLAAPNDLMALGIDGLYADGPDLIGVQNGASPHRVVRLRLDAAGRRITGLEVLERAHPDYAEPTLGVVVGRDLYYVAASQWERFREDGTVDAPETLRQPVILRLELR